ncbi:MAG: DNA primase [Armatimonadota bacterium]
MVDSRSAIEEVRYRINILDVISEYVAVKRAGKNLKGLCPFHGEKTPSFTVNEEYQSWHCFGCGEHGDVFSFLMKMENLSFAETLERLAKRAGVDLAPLQGRQPSRKESLAKINSVAAAYFSTMLKKSPVALNYLQTRGMADQTIDQFRIGYAAPAWDGLMLYLARKGVAESDALDLGLVVHNEQAGKFYDKFRHRIIYPIFDIQDRIIGFGGRSIGDDQPKYMNSPETPLFIKARSLYGLNFARKKIGESGFAVVVEGYMDVITAHQAGFSNCVATLGTALTPDHITVLSRYTKKVVLAYDADSAGMKAALKGAEMFTDAECDVRIVRLPKGDDPDSIIRNGRASEFHAALAGALPITDYKLAILLEKHDTTNPAGRTAILKEAAKIIAEVPSFTERERYIKELISYHPNLDIGNTKAQDQIRADIEAVARRKQGSAVADNTNRIVSKMPSALDMAENIVLKVLAVAGEGSEIVLKSLAPDDFCNEISRSAAKYIYEKFDEKRGIYLPDLHEIADGNLSRFLSELVMRDEGPPVSEKVLQDCITRIMKSKIKLRTSEVLAPHLKQGRIDIEKNNRDQSMQKLEEYLKKSGKLPDTGGQ